MSAVAGAVVAASISADAAAVSATMATITVLGRRPKVTSEALHGHIVDRRFFVTEPDGDAVSVTAVNHRDVPIEVETVWMQPYMSPMARLGAWILRRVSAGQQAGMTALIPMRVTPQLPASVAGHHRLTFRFGCRDIEQAARQRRPPRARRIVRLSDDHLIRTRWLDFSQDHASIRPVEMSESHGCEARTTGPGECPRGDLNPHALYGH